MSLYIKIVLAIAGLVIIWLIWTFNRLVVRRNRTEEAWADVDVQLRRRYNLIPNLVETVKAYAKHESIVLTKVTEARTQAMGAKSLAEHGAAETALTSALRGLFAVAENYPDLKASQNFLQLQDELSDTENKIQASRRFYNGNVRDFNIKMEKFPANLVAGMLGFKPREFFEIAEPAEREAVKVQF